MKGTGLLLLVVPLLIACGTPEAERVAGPIPGNVRPIPEVGLRPDASGVLFRLVVPGPDGNVMLSLEEDGRVVRVDDTSVFSSTADYTTWRLSPEGVARLVEVVETSGILSARPRPGTAEAGLGGGGRTASLFHRGLVSGVDDGLTDRLLDHRWLADEIVEAPRPYVPESMTVRAGAPSRRSGLRPDAPFNPWPYPRPVEAMAESRHVDPDGEEKLVICLRGPEVEPLFALLTGVNRAYLRVDDGRRWELNVQPDTPGYRLGPDRCAPAPRSDPAEVARQKVSLRRLLAQLLDDLEAVTVDHEEVSDTDVRERMADALVRGFVDREAGFELPGEFGMFSADGNRRVWEALERYLTAALVEAADVADRAVRLVAVWDDQARSEAGSSVDDFLGSIDSQS